MLPKGHVGYLRGTWPPSLIVELSTCPVFDHCEKGTFKVYPWMRHMLFKCHADNPYGTRPPSSIVESSTRPVSLRKRNFQSLPLDAPRAHQGSCGLSIGNYASIFNHRIEYTPHHSPSLKRDFESLPLVAPRTLQRSCWLSARNSASNFNHRIEYLPHL